MAITSDDALRLTTARPGRAVRPAATAAGEPELQRRSGARRRVRTGARCWRPRRWTAWSCSSVSPARTSSGGRRFERRARSTTSRWRSVPRGRRWWRGSPAARAAPCPPWCATAWRRSALRCWSVATRSSRAGGPLVAFGFVGGEVPQDEQTRLRARAGRGRARAARLGDGGPWHRDRHGHVRRADRGQPARQHGPRSRGRDAAAAERRRARDRLVRRQRQLLVPALRGPAAPGARRCRAAARRGRAGARRGRSA